MKRFPAALIAAMSQQNTSASSLAKAIDYATSSITRVANDETPASNELVIALCQHFSAVPDIAFELLVCHLFDIAESTGLDLSSLTISHNGKRTDRKSISPGLRSMLDILGAEAMRTPELATTLEDLAALALRYQTNEFDAARYPLPTPQNLKVAEDPPEG